MTRVDDVIAALQALGDPAVIEGRSRYAIRATVTFGVSLPKIRDLARKLGRDQNLAEQLWCTEIHEARLLASLVGDPKVISSATMDLWVSEFESWDVCDACTSNLFDRAPVVWQKLEQWAAGEGEFVRRAAFATLAALAVHNKKAPDSQILATLPLIEQYSFDDRNFVKKAVSWSLRSIGKRNPELREAAIACAGRIQLQGSRAARWIASDVLRELTVRA